MSRATSDRGDTSGSQAGCFSLTQLADLSPKFVDAGVYRGDGLDLSVELFADAVHDEVGESLSELRFGHVRVDDAVCERFENRPGLFFESGDVRNGVAIARGSGGNGRRFADRRAGRTG